MRIAKCIIRFPCAFIPGNADNHTFGRMQLYMDGTFSKIDHGDDERGYLANDINPRARVMLHEIEIIAECDSGSEVYYDNDIDLSHLPNNGLHLFDKDSLHHLFMKVDAIHDKHKYLKDIILVGWFDQHWTIGKKSELIGLRFNKWITAD